MDYWHTYIASAFRFLTVGSWDLGSWEHDLNHEDILGGRFSMVEFYGIVCWLCWLPFCCFCCISS